MSAADAIAKSIFMISALPIDFAFRLAYFLFSGFKTAACLAAFAPISACTDAFLLFSRVFHSDDCPNTLCLFIDAALSSDSVVKYFHDGYCHAYFTVQERISAYTAAVYRCASDYCCCYICCRDDGSRCGDHHSNYAESPRRSWNSAACHFASSRIYCSAYNHAYHCASQHAGGAADLFISASNCLDLSLSDSLEPFHFSRLVSHLHTPRNLYV